MNGLFLMVSLVTLFIGSAHSNEASEPVNIVTVDNEECEDPEVAVERGATWVYVEWKLHCNIPDPEDVAVYKLDLIDNTSGGHIYDDNFSADCRVSDCYYNHTLAHPCLNYTVNLKAVIFNGSEYNYKTTWTQTLEEYPSKVRHLTVDQTTKNSTSISWQPPHVGQFCVNHYMVCHRFIDSMKAVEKCQNVTVDGDDDDDSSLTMDKDDVAGSLSVDEGEGSVTITDLTPCHSYYITVVAVTKEGKLGSKDAVIGDTLDDAPGAPQNIYLKEAAHDFIAFYWDIPDFNFDCINGIKEVCKINTTKSRKEFHQQAASNSITRNNKDKRVGSKYSDVTNLVECTFYDCWVEFLHSQDGTVTSEKITSYTNVIGVTISKPTGVEVLETGEHSLEVAWAFPEQGSRCIDGYKLSWESNEGVNQTEVGNNVLEYAIENLVACTTYNITIAGYSTEWGHHKDGEGEIISHKTSIIAPGEVSNLRVLENTITKTEVTISWEYPLENPQCVQFWNVHLSHGVLDEECHQKVKDDAVFDKIQSVNRLIPCLLCGNDYEFGVEAVSEHDQKSDTATVTFKTADCS